MVVVKKKATRLLISRPRVLKYRAEFLLSTKTKQAAGDYPQLKVLVATSGSIVCVLPSSDVERDASHVPGCVRDEVEYTVGNVLRL